MNWIKQFLNSKRNLGILLGILGLLLIPHVSHAAMFGLDDLAYLIVAKVAYGTSYLISYILGYLIAFAAWLVQVLLDINQNVLNQTPIKIGYPIALAIANLGFIVAIVLIAFATMFRMDGYDVKRTLWKVVLMALLVNFGLVLMQTMLALPNSVSYYFINVLTPTSGGGVKDFAGTMAATFNPQQGLMGSVDMPVVVNATPSSTAALNMGNQFDGFSKLLQPTLSIFFVIASDVVMLLTFLFLAAAMVVRYVYMTVLAIGLPLAWLTWVLPGLKKWWQKWWSEFFKWAFFPPIVLFTMYIAMATLQHMGTTHTILATNQPGIFAQGVSAIINQLLSMIITGSLMIGGVFLGNSLGISFADTTMNYAKSAGKGAANFAKTKSSRLVGDRVRNFGLKATKDPYTGQIETTTTLQRVGGKLSRVPLVGAAIGTSIAKTGTVNRAKDIESAKDKYKALDTQGLLSAWDHTIDPIEKAAIGQMLSTKDWSKAHPDMRKKAEEIQKEMKQVSSRIGAGYMAANTHPHLEEASLNDKERAMDKYMDDALRAEIVRTRGQAVTPANIKAVSGQDVQDLSDHWKRTGVWESKEENIYKRYQTEIDAKAKDIAVTRAARSIKADDIQNLSFDALKDSRVSMALSNSALQAMGNKANGRQQQLLRDSIMALARNIKTMDEAMKAKKPVPLLIPEDQQRDAKRVVDWWLSKNFIMQKLPKDIVDYNDTNKDWLD